MKEIKTNNYLIYLVIFSIGLFGGIFISRYSYKKYISEIEYKYIDAKVALLGNIQILNYFAESRLGDLNTDARSELHNILKTIASSNIESHFSDVQIKNDKIILIKQKKSTFTIEKYNKLIENTKELLRSSGMARD